jgi:CubicO group peptidase (beta-lactamase class C family)
MNFIVRSRLLWSLCVIALVAACPGPSAQQSAAGGSGDAGRVAAVLEPIRARHQLPALGGAIVTSGGLLEIGVTGVRRSGTDVRVTVADKWHLGSDTKAMTAALIGLLIERGRLTWDTTIEDVFPNLASASSSPLKKATIRQLLSHFSGTPGDFPDLQPILRERGVRRRREAVVRLALTQRNVTVGSTFEYSNFGYVIAGAMAERIENASWEDLMTSRVFRPLRMASVGFGGTGTRGKIDQPWPHDESGKPVGNGPEVDNPAFIGPAGTVHCTLGDWAKFVTDQLRGARGEGGLLRPETYRTLHTPPFGGVSALGWGAREWDGVAALTHSGSNGWNGAVVWMAPLRDVATLVVTNQGGEPARMAATEASTALRELYAGR